MLPRDDLLIKIICVVTQKLATLSLSSELSSQTCRLVIYFYPESLEIIDSWTLVVFVLAGVARICIQSTVPACIAKHGVWGCKL